MPAKKNTTRAKSKNTARARLLDQLAKLDELLGDIHRRRMRIEVATTPPTKPQVGKRA